MCRLFLSHIHQFVFLLHSCSYQKFKSQTRIDTLCFHRTFFFFFISFHLLFHRVSKIDFNYYIFRITFRCGCVYCLNRCMSSKTPPAHILSNTTFQTFWVSRLLVFVSPAWLAYAFHFLSSHYLFVRRDLNSLDLHEPVEFLPHRKLTQSEI